MSTAKASSVIATHLSAVHENILAVGQSLDEITKSSIVMVPVQDGTDIDITTKISLNSAIKDIIGGLAAGVPVEARSV